MHDGSLFSGPVTSIETRYKEIYVARKTVIPPLTKLEASLDVIAHLVNREWTWNEEQKIVICSYLLTVLNSQVCHRLLMAECRLDSHDRAHMVFELMEEVEGDGRPNYPLGYYVEAAKDYSNIEDARQYLIKPCPICVEEYPIHEVREKWKYAAGVATFLSQTLTVLPIDLVVILGCGEGQSSWWAIIGTTYLTLNYYTIGRGKEHSW